MDFCVDHGLWIPRDHSFNEQCIHERQYHYLRCGWNHQTGEQFRAYSGKRWRWASSAKCWLRRLCHGLHESTTLSREYMREWSVFADPQ